MTGLTTFPDVYAAARLAELLEAYQAAPIRVRTAVQGLSATAVAARPIEHKWSIQEIVCHLADSEVIGAVRFRQVIAQPGVTVPCYDQDVWASRLDYAARGAERLDRALTLFTALRADVTALLRAQHSESWESRIVHPEYGELTLRQLLELYADHGERHIAQILDRRRLLGHALDLPLLLPDRLY